MPKRTPRPALSWSALQARIIKRDGGCQVCGLEHRSVLAVHHVIPVALGGVDTPGNLVTLCANCHRSVHWLSVGDRSLEPHAFGLGGSRSQRTAMLKLARRIRTRRLREFADPLAVRSSLPLSAAFAAVTERNGLEAEEARLMRRVFRLAWRAIASSDRKLVTVRMPRGARFVSVLANSHLALRLPAWDDHQHRLDENVILIWPKHPRPSVMLPRVFKRESRGSFRLIPYVNLGFAWEEVLSFTPRDWETYRQAVHAGLTLVKTQRRIGNVTVD